MAGHMYGVDNTSHSLGWPSINVLPCSEHREVDVTMWIALCIAPASAYMAPRWHAAHTPRACRPCSQNNSSIAPSGLGQCQMRFRMLYHPKLCRPEVGGTFMSMRTIAGMAPQGCTSINAQNRFPDHMFGVDNT